MNTLAFGRQIALACAAAVVVPMSLAPVANAKAEVPDIRSIAMVDLQRVLNETAAGKRARGELESSSKAKQKQLDRKQQKLEEDMKRAQALTGKELATAQERMQREYVELQQMLFTLQQDLAKQESQLLEKIYKNSQAIVAKIAGERELDLVLVRDPGTVIHVRETYDITDEVIRRYDKSHPK